MMILKEEQMEKLQISLNECLAKHALEFDVPIQMVAVSQLYNMLYGVFVTTPDTAKVLSGVVFPVFNLALKNSDSGIAIDTKFHVTH